MQQLGSYFDHSQVMASEARLFILTVFFHPHALCVDCSALACAGPHVSQPAVFRFCVAAMCGMPIDIVAAQRHGCDVWDDFSFYCPRIALLTTQRSSDSATAF